MANNKIQIKRSTSNSNVTGLSNGELAFTQAGNTLHIGLPDGSGVLRIGGAMVPGVLTNNHALVANTTGGIDKVITANLTLGGASVTAINAVANLTTLGTPSNTELTTTWAIKTFVDAKIAQASNPQGTNGQFQYNDSGVLNGTNNMVFDKTTGQITVGNSSVNVQIGYTGSINALAHFHGQQNGYVQVILQNSNGGNRASSDYVLENDLGSETANFLDLGINSSTYDDPSFNAMGAGDSYLYASNNDLVIGTASASDIRFITGGTTTSEIRVEIDGGGNVGIGNTSPNARLQVTGTANISGLVTLGANLVLTAPLIANGTSGSSGQLLTSNGTTGAPYWAAAPTTVAGSTTQVQYNDGGSLAGAAGLTFAKGTNNVTIANSLLVGASANADSFTVGSVFIANTTTLNTNGAVVNSTGGFFTGYVNASGFSTTGSANAGSFRVSTNFIANSTQLTLSGIPLSANGGVGTQAQILASNGATGSPYWTTAAVGTITGVTAGAGLTGGGSSGSVTLDAGAGNGISVSADAIAVFANGSSAVVSNTTGVHIKIGAGLVFDGSGNVAVNSNALTNFQDLTVSGNLTVLGDLVSLNVATLTVEDSMITLAKDQSSTSTFTDAVDVGFFGTYGNTANAFVSGLFRDQSDSGIWKLFTSNGTYTNAIINTTNTVAFTLATLQSYLTSGGLISNAGSVAITANATVNVNISANILSLSGRSNNDLLFTNATGGVTARALGTSGYVVQSNGTAIVYDTLDGGTF